MKMISAKKILSLAAFLTLASSLITGCQKADDSASEAASSVAASAEVSDQKTALYFPKGVYLLNESDSTDTDRKIYYVFDSETTGHTDDGVSGLPFACEQRDGGMWFSFGGADSEGEDFLTVDSSQDGVVKGHFKDGKTLVFEPVPGADADTFDAANYSSAASGEPLLYTDANGWSVRYDPKLITINGGGPMVTFVYTGDSAGTNMVTVTYNVDKDAKTAIADLARDLGDKATTQESIFPGTEDVTGYWAMLGPEEDGTGDYITAVARDYMDGYLMFELTGHNSGNDEADMAVSDTLAGIIDSIQFNN